MRRTRFRLAGALLLGTLLLSFAEAAAAATCDPAMAEMPQSGMAGMPDMPAAPSDHDCPPGHGHGGTGDENNDCPFTPAGGIGCVVTVSLPADATRVSEPPQVRADCHRSIELIAHHLQARSIFHPPKA